MFYFCFCFCFCFCLGDQVNLISKKLELLPLSSFAPRSHSNSESNSESIDQSTQPKRIYQLSETSDPGSDSSESLSHEVSIFINKCYWNVCHLNKFNNIR